MAAGQINIDAYTDALVVLGTAGIVVPLVQRWRVSPVLGYLAAGVVLGPLGLGSFKDDMYFLRWVTVIDAKNVAEIAELGVVFLLFLIGLELSFDRLMTMRRLVFGLGSLQVVLSAGIIGGVAALFGNGAAASAIIGACLALSSTAIVIEVLSSQRRLTTASGRTCFSVLLFQDLAVIPILLFISILGMRTGGSVVAGLALALAQAVAAIGLIIVIGRFLLRPLLRLVASAQASELFVAGILFIVVGIAVIAGVAGLSMALGAFVAGLMLAETEFRKAIETTIEPFKGLLLGIFFFTVGMGVDVRELAREPLWLFASVAGLVAIKAVLLTGLARLFRVPLPAAIETGLLLGPGGEFAFVALGLAATLGLLSAGVSSFMLAVTSLTMALIPLLGMAARRIAVMLEKRKPLEPELAAAPPAVSAYRRRGREVYYGDATNPAFLKSCGLMGAVAVIVTIHTQASIDEIVQIVRELRPDMLIVSRARDATHARHLYAIGVTDAVPETIEASLQLSEAALVGLGLPAGPVIASIHEKRDEFRHELQEAAGLAGKSETRSIRAKTLRRS